MSDLPIFHNLPGGRLYTDSGKPIPAEVPAGYTRDKMLPRMFHPIAPPPSKIKEKKQCCRGLG